jgi:hypothetical protein
MCFLSAAATGLRCSLGMHILAAGIRDEPRGQRRMRKHVSLPAVLNERPVAMQNENVEQVTDCDCNDVQRQGVVTFLESRAKCRCPASHFCEFPEKWKVMFARWRWDDWAVGCGE